MALLASQIPLLYCLLYLQSNRRPALNQSKNSLLTALTSQRRSSASQSPSHSLTAMRRDSSQELFAHEKHLAAEDHDSLGKLLSSDVEEKSWVRHQDPDPRQLCLERYSHPPPPSRSSSTSKNYFLTNEDCTKKHQDSVREIMSGRFMTVQQLQTILPEMTKFHGKSSSPTARYRADALPYANLKSSSDNHCRACNTEIVYEVATNIRDFKGVNYTVINFQNAYQFIPAGRCMNENIPCGGGGNARCVQIYRAQWTLVWASSPGGTRLVAHEVPSHCQCVNVGSPVQGSVKSSSAKPLQERAHSGKAQRPPQ